MWFMCAGEPILEQHSDNVCLLWNVLPVATGATSLNWDFPVHKESVAFASNKFSCFFLVVAILFPSVYKPTHG